MGLECEVAGKDVEATADVISGLGPTRGAGIDVF